MVFSHNLWSLLKHTASYEDKLNEKRGSGVNFCRPPYFSIAGSLLRGEVLDDPIRTLEHLHFVKMWGDALQQSYYALTQAYRGILTAPFSE